MKGHLINSKYRLSYYQINKEKIQAYQREYYRKYLKKKRQKPTKLHWKGEKTIGGLKIVREKIVLNF